MNWSERVQQQNPQQRQYGISQQSQNQPPRQQQRNQYQQNNYNHQGYGDRNRYNQQNNRSSQGHQSQGHQSQNINNNNNNNSNINNNNNNQSQQTQNQQNNQSLSSVPSKQNQSQQTVNVLNNNNNNNINNNNNSNNNNNNSQQQNITKQSVSAQTDNTNTIQPQQTQNVSNDIVSNQPPQTDNNNINNSNVPDEESQQQQQQNTEQQQQQNVKSSVDVTPSEQQQQEQQQGQSSQIDNKEQESLVNDDQQSLASGTTPKKKPFSSANSINNKMFFGTRYEVKCDETFAYYEGYVFDYDEKENKLKVSYPWKADQSVPVNYVRPVAPAVDPSWKPKQGDHVECQAKAEESEPYGWWDCTIKTVRDNLYLITYEGWDNHHEVLQHNMLRPYNDQEPFEDVGITRDFYELSEERIQEFKDNQQNLTTFMNSSDDKNGFGVDENMNKSETTMDQLRRIAKQTNLIHLNFSYSEEKLILIGTKQQVRDAKMLIEFVWSLRETYKQKEDQVKKDEKRQQKEFDQLKKCIKLTFKFNISLTKYVIGLGGDNIAKAKEIEGVKHINVRNTGDETMSECLILATDQNAAEEARAILEMSQDYELIPADPFVRKELIGIEGKNIQDLEKRSNVIKICTLEHLKYIRDSSRNYYQTNRRQNEAQQSFINEEEPQDTNFKKLIIIGPREKVPFAKMLIKSQVDLIQQRSALLERKKNAQKDLYHQKQTSYYNEDGNNDNNNNYNGDYYNNNNNNNNNDGYHDGGNYGYHHDEYNNNNNNYGNYNDNYDGGQGRQQSARRQRKREQQQATEQSNRDTSHFNYVDNQRGNRQQSQQQNYVNDDPDFPQLGTNPQKNLNDSQIESKDVSNEDDNQQQEVSWLEHDKAGMEEDEQENVDNNNNNNNNNNNQSYQQQEQQRHGGRGGGRRYQGSGGGGGGGGQGGSSYDGGYDDGYQEDRRRSSYHKKPVWKQKEKSTNSLTEANNTSSNQ